MTNGRPRLNRFDFGLAHRIHNGRKDVPMDKKFASIVATVFGAIIVYFLSGTVELGNKRLGLESR